MYLTVENIRNLDNIISNFNVIEDEDEKEQFLKNHIEDTALFLDAIKKINKKKITIMQSEIQKKRRENDVKTSLYKEEDIYMILSQKSNAEIVKEYSLSDLRRMYVTFYKKSPASNYTKQRILGILRNRMHTMKRAEAFALAADERCKDADHVREYGEWR